MARFRHALLLAALDAAGIYLLGVIGSTFILKGTFDLEQALLWTKLTVLFVPLQLIINHYLGLYSGVLRYASVREMLRVIVATGLGALSVFFVLGYQSGFVVLVFRTVPLYWLLSTSVVGGVRFAVRLHSELSRNSSKQGEPALIVGAGDAGYFVGRQLQHNTQIATCPVGYIDEDRGMHGLLVNGLKVWGSISDLPSLADSLGIKRVIIPTPSLSAEMVRSVAHACAEAHLKLSTIPVLQSSLGADSPSLSMREVQIEDLLYRDEVKMTTQSVANYLSNRVVLITGAGGSIGSEICRHVARLKPLQLILLGHGEDSIFRIHNELATGDEHPELTPVIVDIKDRLALGQVFAQYKPHVVFHAAAHKHVPLMETNVAEAIRNNVLGTMHVAELAKAHEAECFVLISTDKAVCPTSVMGATKRAAELGVQMISQGCATRFVTVRFGNVLGSRGSVLELFKSQIARGGPVTVTHPNMERYFMTIPEAASLVVQAGALGTNGYVYLLDMGVPIRIVDLAHDLIALSGYKVGRDIEVIYTGLRPGEKLHEALVSPSEIVLPTEHIKIGMAQGNPLQPDAIRHMLTSLEQLAYATKPEPSVVLRIINDVGQTEAEVAATEVCS